MHHISGAGSERPPLVCAEELTQTHTPQRSVYSRGIRIPILWVCVCVWERERERERERDRERERVREREGEGERE